MRRSLHLLVLGFVFVAGLTGAYLVVVDADHTPVPPPDVDDGDDAAIVEQAIAHLHSADYQAEIRIGWRNETADESTVDSSEKPELRHEATARIQNSERRALIVQYERERELYVNLAQRWHRFDDSDWSTYRSTEWQSDHVNPLTRADGIEESAVERVRETEETVVFEITNPDAAGAVHGEFETYENPTLELTLDRNSGALLEATLVDELSETNEVVYHVITVEDHGDVDVERPGDLSVSLSEWVKLRYYEVR